MGQRIFTVAGVERSPRKRDVDRSMARNGRSGTVGGGGCTAETKVSAVLSVGVR